MLYLFAGGGTGGHLMPGVALAQKIKTTQPEADILFAASARDSDRETLEQYDLPRVQWGARRWTDWIDMPTFVAANCAGLAKAIRGVARLKPDVVISSGGYVAAFPSVAAILLRKPLVLLEQNVTPGRVTRALAKHASLICCQWRESVRRFPIQASVSVTGNPVRAELLGDDPFGTPEFGDLAADAPTVLVMGGSQGASAINSAVTAALPRMTGNIPGIQFIHLAGADDCEDTAEAYRRAQVPAYVTDYLNEMASAYQRADVVVSRAGGTSIAEITALGKAAILIPYPYAAEDHQRANARALSDCGAAEMIDPNRLTPDILAAKLETLLSGDSLRRGMAARARELGRPGAAAEIFTGITELTTNENTVRQEAHLEVAE